MHFRAGLTSIDANDVSPGYQGAYFDVVITKKEEEGGSSSPPPPTFDSDDENFLRPHITVVSFTGESTTGSVSNANLGQNVSNIPGPWSSNVRSSPDNDRREENGGWHHFSLSWSNGVPSGAGVLGGGGFVSYIDDAGLPFSQSYEMPRPIPTFAMPASTKLFVSLGVGALTDPGLMGEMDGVCIFARALDAEEVAVVREFGCRPTSRSGDAAADADDDELQALYEEVGLDLILKDLVWAYAFDDADDPMLEETTGTSQGDFGNSLFANTEVCDVCLDTCARDSSRSSSSATDGGGDSVSSASRPPSTPFFMSSSAPIPGGRISFVRRPTAYPATALKLPCANCLESDVVTIAAVPNDGGVLCKAATSPPLGGERGLCPADYVEVLVGDTLSYGEVSSGGLLYDRSTATTPGSETTFRAGVSPAAEDDAEEGVAVSPPGPLAKWVGTIRTNTPPEASSSQVDIPEMQMWRPLFLPANWGMVTDVDGDLDDIRAEIHEVVGEAVTIYDCEYCVDALWDASTGDGVTSDLFVWEHRVTTFPHMVFKNRQIAVRPNLDLSTGDSATIRFRLFDGIDYSEDASVQISVVRSNLPPEVSTSTYEVEISEDGVQTIDMSTWFTDREDDVWSIVVEELPAHGKLIQVGGNNPGSEYSANSPVVVLSQWAIDSPDNSFSSCWDDVYCIKEATGEPDQWPSTEDSPSWQGDGVPEHMENLWVILNYKEPVFPSEMIVYECWSPGAIVKIEALDFDSSANKDTPISFDSDWIPIFEGENRQSQFCPELDKTEKCAGVSRYILCPLSFRSRSFKLSWKLDDIYARWASLDAIKLVGYSVANPSAIQGLGMKSLQYVPAPNYYGPDTFRFAAFDCPYFSTFGSLVGPSTRHGEVSLSVAGTHDATEFVDLPGDGPVYIDPYFQVTYDPNVVLESTGVPFIVHFLDYDGIRLDDGGEDSPLSHSVEVTVMAPLFGGLLLRVGSSENAVDVGDDTFDVPAKGVVITDSGHDVLRSKGTMAFVFEPRQCVQPILIKGVVRVTITDLKSPQKTQVSRLYRIDARCNDFKFPSKMDTRAIAIIVVGVGLAFFVVVAVVMFFKRKSSNEIAESRKNIVALSLDIFDVVSDLVNYFQVGQYCPSLKIWFELFLGTGWVACSLNAFVNLWQFFHVASNQSAANKSGDVLNEELQDLLSHFLEVYQLSYKSKDIKQLEFEDLTDHDKRMQMVEEDEEDDHISFVLVPKAEATILDSFASGMSNRISRGTSNVAKVFADRRNSNAQEVKPVVKTLSRLEKLGGAAGGSVLRTPEQQEYYVKKCRLTCVLVERRFVLNEITGLERFILRSKAGLAVFLLEDFPVCVLNLMFLHNGCVYDDNTQVRPTIFFLITTFLTAAVAAVKINRLANLPRVNLHMKHMRQLVLKDRRRAYQLIDELEEMEFELANEENDFATKAAIAKKKERRKTEVAHAEREILEARSGRGGKKSMGSSLFRMLSIRTLSSRVEVEDSVGMPTSGRSTGKGSGTGTKRVKRTGVPASPHSKLSFDGDLT